MILFWFGVCLLQNYLVLWFMFDTSSWINKHFEWIVPLIDFLMLYINHQWPKCQNSFMICTFMVMCYLSFGILQFVGDGACIKCWFQSFVIHLYITVYNKWWQCKMLFILELIMTFVISVQDSHRANTLQG